MKRHEIYNSAQMIELIQEIGFLPLLDSGISGYSAEEMVADDCRYVVLPDGGWDWSMLTTPEQLHGLTSFECPRTPEESFDRILVHFKSLLPHASEKQILKLIK